MVLVFWFGAPEGTYRGKVLSIDLSRQNKFAKNSSHLKVALKRRRGVVNMTCLEHLVQCGLLDVTCDMVTTPVVPLLHCAMEVACNTIFEVSGSIL